MIAFAHFTQTRNIGDLMSGPYRYFNFSPAQVFDLRRTIPACEAVIFGGGSIAGLLHRRQPQRVVNARWKIAWGIGTSHHGLADPGPLPQGFHLLGSRDIGAGRYVPCASCMAELFDHPPRPKHELVVFLNDDPKIPPPCGTGGLPVMGNWIPAGATPEKYFVKVIRHLSSGNTVLTNSYHGAFWATLLGRKVVVAPAYSSKLMNLKFPPAPGSADGWRSSLNKALAYPEALEDSRAVTKAFRRRVGELLGV